MVKGSEHRTSAYPIAPVLLDRWSPRAMSGEPVAHDMLMTLFEAARWAPSSYNAQPWRFLYATREGGLWQTYLDLLVPMNALWAGRAGALVVAVSETINRVTGQESTTHSFDTGLACENLAIQGASLGLAIHMMQGFDHDAARVKLRIPEDLKVEVMIAIGHPGDPASLPGPLQEREHPSGRKEASQFVIEGAFEG